MSIATNPLRSIAADLGWAGRGEGQSAWSYERLLDHAVADYWRNRPIPTAADQKRGRYRRHKRRQDTVPPEVWQRRAAA